MKTTYKSYIIRKSWSGLGGYDFHAICDGQLHYADTYEDMIDTIDELTKEI